MPPTILQEIDRAHSQAQTQAICARECAVSCYSGRINEEVKGMRDAL